MLVAHLLLFSSSATFLGAASASTITGGCPLNHPYAFFEGALCCAFPEEDELTTFEQARAPTCDGGVLRLNSLCCRFDESVACPSGNGCRSTEREACYVDGVLISFGMPGLEFQQSCAQQAIGDKEAWTVKERLEGDTEWTNVGGCDFKDGQIAGCISGISSESGLSPDVSPHDVRRALTTRPKTRRCENLGRRWMRIDGNFKCRTVQE